MTVVPVEEKFRMPMNRCADDSMASMMPSGANALAWSDGAIFDRLMMGAVYAHGGGPDNPP